MDPTVGRAWVIDGEIYFSPNSCRYPGRLPERTEVISFQSGVSQADEFQNPRWWTPATEWMGFVPRQPVSYIGVWFESLGLLPRWLSHSASDGYYLPGTLREQWLVVEDLLYEVTTTLCKRNNFHIYWPFVPRAWRYNVPHQSHQVVAANIKAGRDWFAMWIGVLFWITRKIPEDKHYVDGLSPPGWFIMVMQHMRKHAALDSIRMAPLLRTNWDISRVGLLLLPPLEDQNSSQPSAAWFMHQDIPVWYRWGYVERSNATRMENLGYPVPLPEHLQAATTWISPSLSIAPQHLQPTTTRFSPALSVAPATPASPATWVDVGDFPDGPIQSSPTSPINGGIFGEDVGSPVWDNHAPGTPPLLATTNSVEEARAIWDNFWREREVQHEKMRMKEVPGKRLARENRERKPPTVSADVFEWEWDFGNPPRFARTLVRKKDREETLDRYGHDQKRYDSFFNEWHCCGEWGTDREGTPDADLLLVHPDAFDEPRAIADGSASLGLASSGAEVPPGTSNHSSSEDRGVPTLSREEILQLRLAQTIKETLYEWMGFVAPIIDEPSSHRDLSITKEQKQALVWVLGLGLLKSDNPFFDTPLGTTCVEFCRYFTTGTETPPADLWDLSGEATSSLHFNDRVGCIRVVENSEKKLFMFDFGTASTTPWKIAVYSATAALYVCRLENALREEEIAFRLVSEGIPFRTLREMTSLGPAPAEGPPCVIVPMRLSGHEFDKEDYEFYEKQCRALMSISRARAALLRGGYSRRIALDHIRTDEVIRGPCGIHSDPKHMFIVKDSSGVRYVDDELTQNEYDILVGVYNTFTGSGSQVAKLSWYPPVSVYEDSGEDVGRWTDRLAEIHEKRRTAISNDSLPYRERSPMSSTMWKNQVRGYSVTRRVKKRLESLCAEFIKEHGGNA